MLEYLLAMHPQHGPAIERALHQLVSKRVISSLAPIFLAETLEPALRDRVRAVFGTIIESDAPLPDPEAGDPFEGESWEWVGSAASVANAAATIK